jgi:AcrR family transcriptional regulator
MNRPNVKERIVQTASRLFYENGYNQTGINQIIAEAEVAKASLYQHFRSKQDIAVAYLNHRHYWWMEQLANFVADESTAKNKILGSFDFLSFWLENASFRGCGFQNIIADLPQEHSKIKVEVLFHKNELIRWIQNLLVEGDNYPPENTLPLARQIFVLIDGAIISAQIQNDTWPIASAKNICELLLE